MSFKILTTLLAIAACANAFAWREGALRAMLLYGFLALGVLLALAGGFSYWWDSSMQPTQKSAAILVSGLVMLLASAVGIFRLAADDEFR